MSRSDWSLIDLRLYTGAFAVELLPVVAMVVSSVYGDSDVDETPSSTDLQWQNPMVEGLARVKPRRAVEPRRNYSRRYCNSLLKYL
jgi:hypothetical protein